MTDVSPIALDLASRLATQGITFRVRNNRLWVLPPKRYKELSEEDRALVREHRRDLKKIVRDGLTDRPSKVVANVAPKLEEPEPDVWAFGRRVTRRDVVETLKAHGDQVFADYQAGRISKAEAYEMARRRLRQGREMRARPPVWRPGLRIE